MVCTVTWILLGILFSTGYPISWARMCNDPQANSNNATSHVPAIEPEAEDVRQATDLPTDSLS
jgi:hypothetical protein